MSGGSEYRPSHIDGLPARVSGAWAREKLAYLARNGEWDLLEWRILSGASRKSSG